MSTVLPLPAAVVRVPRFAVWRPYLELTKPGITLFIGISAGAGFIAASAGVPVLPQLALALVATMLMSGGAAALNHVAERASDARMRRTAGRPLPSGLLTVSQAVQFGWLLSALGFAVALALPPLAALFLVLSHLSYVYLYTPLKRRTPFCTLAGALPGALPVLAGWCAAGTPLHPGAFALATVLFMWQIPHFVAIGWLAREDYARAGYPMLGVVDPSGGSSARVALAYASVMIVAALGLGSVMPTGFLYAATALGCGLLYAGLALRFALRPERATARRLFLSSLLVLPLLLGALVLDLLAH